MKVRMPDFRFEGAAVAWCKNRECAQGYNATSVVPVHMEPYLIKVISQLRVARPRQMKALHAEISLFIRQEGEHLRLHRRFNDWLYQVDYPELAAVEARVARHYRDLLVNRSLRFNTAYADGVEAVGAVAAEVFFASQSDLMRGASGPGFELFRWHMAEEFEHREVFFRANRAAFGSGFVSYIYRIMGFFLAARDLARFSGEATSYVLARDRARLAPEELARSIRREKATNRRLALRRLPRVLAVLSPFYDPGRKPMPAALEACLAHYGGAAGRAVTP